MKLILVGTLAGGFAAAAVIRAAEEAEAFVVAKLANGELAEAIEVQTPKAGETTPPYDENGRFFIAYGTASTSGVSLFGPFAESEDAEEYGERHRSDGDEWKLIEFPQSESRKDSHPRRRGSNAAAATKFFQELCDSVETLTGIAEQYGAATLADLMYLQNAIAKGTFIEHYPGESAVLTVVRTLPSSEQWLQSIQIVNNDGEITVTLKALLATDKAFELDRLLKQAATESDYDSTLDVSWDYWHYGRHAEHAEQNGRPVMARLFAAAWQIEHRLHGELDRDVADVVRDDISAEFPAP